MPKIFKDFTEESWQKVLTHPFYAETIAATVKSADELMETEPPRLTYSGLHIFEATGNRKIYEKKYSSHRERLNTFFMAYMFTKDEKYIEPLADTVWDFCNMETWAIPAHVRETESLDKRRQFLELVSTGIGALMATVLHFVGDKLPELVYRRAMYETKHRIIDSYKKYVDDGFWWYTASNNWSAVCIANVLQVFVIMADEEEVREEIPRMMNTAQCFLNGIPDDGCCLEGYGYWKYGFEAFCEFAVTLRDFTDGEIDYFKDEKVRKIALFQQNISINETQCLSFSDSGLSFSPSSALSSLIKREYPDIDVPPIEKPNSSKPSLMKLFWLDPELIGSKIKPKNYIFTQAQWFISHRAGYSVGAKAGSNKEPHNHLDVGSFLISKNNAVTFADPGGGEYNKSYFGAGRYTNLVTSARGHSVPVINGAFQCKSDVKSTVYTAEEYRFTFSMENAYDIESLKSLTRDFDCREDCLVLTDTYDFTEMPTEVKERFIALTPIEYDGEAVKCGDSVMTFDNSLYSVELFSEDVRRNSGTVSTVYMIELTAKKLDTHMELSFKFE